MTKIEIDLDTKVPPERVLAALTDFTEHRSDIWPGLTPELYKVYDVGQNSALIQEGTKLPVSSVWARERYDWSQPGTVSWIVVESNFVKPGLGVTANVAPTTDGGSHIHVTWEREGANLKGRFIVFMMRASKGKPILRSFRQAMENIEHEG